MRNVLMIGGEGLSAFRDWLAGEGYEVSLRPPGELEGWAGHPNIVLVEIEAAAEDPEVKRYLQEASTPSGPAVLAVVDPARPSGFEPALGLDDFVSKSASAEELALRVRQAIWRRTGVDSENVLRCGDLEMDLANYTVHIGGNPVDLTYKEYELLRFLATNADRVLNRETLLNKVWGYDFYGGGRTVDVHIRRLRSKIEDRHHTFIETVRNVGYRFRSKLS
jgi:DNA-binding response OmpR family regulator